MKISIIAATQQCPGPNCWGIGYDDQLLHHISEDLKNFKAVTLGKPVIMGRKTWDSLTKKPLPGRLNIVLSRSTEEIKDAVVHSTIKSAIESLGDHEEIFIIGGGMIYEQALPWANRIYLSLIQSNKKANIFFPEINLTKDFPKIITYDFKLDEKTNTKWNYLVADKK